MAGVGGRREKSLRASSAQMKADNEVWVWRDGTAASRREETVTVQRISPNEEVLTEWGLSPTPAGLSTALESLQGDNWGLCL